jgi:hypothetical protein
MSLALPDSLAEPEAELHCTGQRQMGVSEQIQGWGTIQHQQMHQQGAFLQSLPVCQHRAPLKVRPRGAFAGEPP